MKQTKENIYRSLIIAIIVRFHDKDNLKANVMIGSQQLVQDLLRGSTMAAIRIAHLYDVRTAVWIAKDDAVAISRDFSLRFAFKK